jgi:hypothetical protein
LLVLVNLADARKRPLGARWHAPAGRNWQACSTTQLLIVDGHRRARSEERALPQPARIFPAAYRDSFDIVSDVATATHIAHQQGAFIVSAAPEVLMKKVEGRVWEWLVASSELTAVKSPPRERHHAASDGVRVRALSDAQPAPEAQAVTPNSRTPTSCSLPATNEASPKAA